MRYQRLISPTTVYYITAIDRSMGQSHLSTRYADTKTNIESTSTVTTVRYTPHQIDMNRILNKKPLKYCSRLAWHTQTRQDKNSPLDLPKEPLDDPGRVVQFLPLPGRGDDFKLLSRRELLLEFLIHLGSKLEEAHSN